MNIKELNFLLKPLGIFIFIVLLFIGSCYYGLEQINLLKTKINVDKKSQKVLGTKLSILQNVENIIPSDISFIDIALPSRGIAIYAMNQVKNQANSLGLIISNLKTGAVTPDKDGISKVNISFEIEGDEQSVYNYLESFPELLPLMKIDKVSINSTDGIVRASVSVSAFSGELPKKIPSITTSVTDLTSDEVKVLNEISGYQKPQFVVINASNETPKEDPFN